MGVIENKSNLFSEIAVVNAIQDNFPDINNSVNSVESISSKSGNLIPFMLDLLTNLVDGKVIKSEFTRFLSKTDSFEEKIKTSLVGNVLDNYTRNFDFVLPTGVITTMPIKDLDVNDTLKTDPNSEMGKFNYGKDPNTDFSSFLHGVTQTGSGTWGDMLDFSYDSNENVEIGFTQSYAGKSFETFAFDFTNSTKIIEPNVLLSTIVDDTFGTVSSLADKGKDGILDKLKFNENVDKIIDKESSSETPTPYDNSFFEFNKTSLDKMNKKLSGLIDGTYLSDLGCGFGESFIDMGSFSSSFVKINDIRPSLVKEATIEFTNTLLDQSTVGIDDDNKDAVELNIISDIFKNLPSILLGLTIKPATLLLIQMAEVLTNGSPLSFGSHSSLAVSSLDTLMITLKDMVVCLVKQIYSMVVEFLFYKVKAELLKLAAILATKVLQDQLKNYKQILDTVKTLLSQIDNIFSLITGS